MLPPFQPSIAVVIAFVITSIVIAKNTKTNCILIFYRNIPTFLSLVTVTKMGLDIDKVGAVTYNHRNTEGSPSMDFLKSLEQYNKLFLFNLTPEELYY